jgi:hypothetical protein
MVKQNSLVYKSYNALDNIMFNFEMQILNIKITRAEHGKAFKSVCLEEEDYN